MNDEAGADGEVVIECDLDAEPHEVWRALTVDELARQWLDLGDGDDAARYDVVETLPHSRVRYAWRDERASEPDTEVTIDLAPLPGGRTRFRLTHGVARGTPPAAANGNRPPTLARAA